MRTIFRLVFLGAILGMISSDALAQRGGRGGAEGGGRGGRPGGAEGGRGGRPGGAEGGRGGGERGGGGRGGFGGGGGETGGRGGFGGQAGGRGGFGGGDTGGRGGFGGAGGSTRGGFGGGGGMSRLDSNGDGRIDQAEIDRIPDGFKQAMESRGVKLRPGSIDEVTSSMRSQFERSRTGEGGEGGQGGDRSSQANRSTYSPAAPFRAREKERVTVDLPPKYSELDLDFDGQIGLYEWITAKRESLNEFDEIDVNVDGLLTPKELKFYDEISAAGEKKVVSYKRERVMIIDGRGEYTGRKSGLQSSQVSKMSPEEQEKTLESGKRYFSAMDKNKNGKVDKEEWESSKRIRPWFEKSGIKLDSMGEEDFSKNFLKAVEMMKKDGGKDGGKDKTKRR